MKTKTRFHKLTAWLLTLAMLMTFMPSFTLSAFAADGDIASVTTSDGNTQYYTDLSTAFTAASEAENSTVTLLADIDMSAAIYVYSGKFTIDLNGKTCSSSGRVLEISNADVLITDKTSEGSGKIVGYDSTIITGDDSTLEIAGGTVENMDTLYCVETQYSGHTTNAQFTLSGGKLVTKGWSAINVDCTSVTIKGGEIESTGDSQYHGDDHDYRSGLLDFSQHPDPTGIAVISYADEEIIPSDTTIKLPAGYCFYEQISNNPVTSFPINMVNGYIIGKVLCCTCVTECTEDNVNSECAVCSVDLSGCTGVHTHSLDYKYSDTEHWQECTAEDCPDKEGSKTNLTSHSYDNDTDTTCVCGYTRTLDNDDDDTSDTPVITSFTIDSDSPAYNAETNTFYYDAEHTLDLLISGKNLEGQRIYIALGNSAGIHTFFLYTAKHATEIGLQLSKRTLDSTLKTFAENGLAADIVRLWVHLRDVDGETHYLPLNVLPISYTVTFDANGGNTETATMTTVDGKLEALPTPTRNGYTFDGWFDAETGGNKVTYDTMFFDDTTVYAQWTALPPKITGISVDEASDAYNSETNTFTVTKDTPFVVYITGEYFENIDNTFLEETSFGFVPSVDDSDKALGNSLYVFKEAGLVTINADENTIILTFNYDAMKAFVTEYGKFEGICYGDIENIKEENIKPINIALAKYDPTYTEPTVKTDLVYNGTEQELLYPGTAEGGTMKYFVGITQQATAEVPKRASAGEYTVTCIVAGDKIHNDIVVGEYTVTIAKKTIDSTIALTTPVKNTTPQTEITGDGYTATVVWSPEVTDRFSYNTEYTATVTITPDENHTVAGIAANGYTVEGAKTVTNEENSNIITVTYEKTGSRPSGGSSSNTTTTTTKNEDGSTTKTTTNKATGTTTEVTTNTDGSTTTVETKKDGTVTTTEKDKDGNTTTIVEKSDGTSTTTEKNKDGSEKVTEEKADGTTVTTEKDTDGTKTVTTEKADGSTTTEETKKDGTKVTTETNADGETTAEVSAKGETEVVVPVPDAEEVYEVVVTDENGNETVITDFEVVDGGVAITVDGNASVSLSKGSKKEFVDVHPVDHWSEESVDYVYIRGLMKGTSENHFSPDATLTRAMLVTILYRLEGELEMKNAQWFEDVEKGQWYSDAVAWATFNGITMGYGNGNFGPDDNITREQIAAIMHRYADFKGHDVSVGENTNILSYDDIHHVSEYAIGAMQYAVGSGLIKGKTESTLNPLDNATRAEAAAILERFIKAN